MDNEYVYHTVFICRGATRDMCVTRKFPMIGRAGLEEIRQALHAYLKLVEGKDAPEPVFLATPVLVGYLKDGQPWEPQVEKA